MARGKRNTRDDILAAGRQAAVSRRKADSDACRQRVEGVITEMKRRREVLTDAAITRRAHVNAQYLQRHQDLRALADAVRAEVRGSKLEAEAAARAGAAAHVGIENKMLLEQNKHLREELDAAIEELKRARATTLAARSSAVVAPAIDDPVVLLEQAVAEREAALQEVRRLELEVVALRNMNQRLMMDNSRLLDSPQRSATK